MDTIKRFMDKNSTNAELPPLLHTLDACFSETNHTIATSIVAYSMYDEEHTLMDSIIKGDLEMVKYILDHCVYVPVDEETMIRCVVKHGHLDILKYLIEDCGVDEYEYEELIFTEAEKYGHHDIDEYITKVCGTYIL